MLALIMIPFRKTFGPLPPITQNKIFIFDDVTKWPAAQMAQSKRPMTKMARNQNDP